MFCARKCCSDVEWIYKGGILWYKENFDKPVMITFTAATVAPATRDVNAVFCANWDDEQNDLGDSYVCGLNGWYENKAGVERSGERTQLLLAYW